MKRLEGRVCVVLEWDGAHGFRGEEGRVCSGLQCEGAQSIMAGMAWRLEHEAAGHLNPSTRSGETDGFRRPTCLLLFL